MFFKLDLRNFDWSTKTGARFTINITPVEKEETTAPKPTEPAEPTTAPKPTEPAEPTTAPKPTVPTQPTNVPKPTATAESTTAPKPTVPEVTDTKIYFEVPDWWGEVKWNRKHTIAAVYCHLYNVYGGSPLESYTFATKKKRCEWEHDNIYSFDTTRVGTIEEGADYGVVFCADCLYADSTTATRRFQITDTTMGIQCLGDTIYPTTESRVNSIDPEKRDYIARWKDPINNEIFGPMKLIDSLGNLTEGKLPLYIPKAMIIADWLFNSKFKESTANHFITECLNKLETELEVTALEVFDWYIWLRNTRNVKDELVSIPDDFSYVAERLGLQYGDADSDGYITISDATKIQKHCAELVELSPGQAELADFDGNKTLNIADATKIQMKLADLI